MIAWRGLGVAVCAGSVAVGALGGSAPAEPARPNVKAMIHAYLQAALPTAQAKGYSKLAESCGTPTGPAVYPLLGYGYLCSLVAGNGTGLDMVLYMYKTNIKVAEGVTVLPDFSGTMTVRRPHLAPQYWVIEREV